MSIEDPYDLNINFVIGIIDLLLRNKKKVGLFFIVNDISFINFIFKISNRKKI